MKKFFLILLVTTLLLSSFLFFKLKSPSKSTEGVIEGVIYELREGIDDTFLISIISENPELDRIILAVPSENYSEHSEQLKIDRHVEIVYSTDQQHHATVSPMTIEAEIISVNLE